MEIWKKLKDYEEVYEISNLGRIRSNRAKRHYGKILKLYTNKKGYQMVHLCLDRIERTYKVSRLVAKTWIKNTDESKIQVNHINGVKNDDRECNLEWCTPSENILHAFRTGLKTVAKGENVKTSKLKSQDVINIRKLRAEGVTCSKLGVMYNVSQSYISSIARRKLWAHI